MRKSATAILAVTLVCVTLSACADEGSSAAAANCSPKVKDDALVKPGTLTYATNATLRPMQYVEDSKIVGMRIEMAQELARRLCLDVNVINVPFEAQIPGVQGGRWDMINTGMFYKPDRAETMALVPYEVQGVAISVAKDNPKGVKSVQDLAGMTLGVEAPGYEFDTLTDLKSKVDGMQVKAFQTNADAFQALSADQVDGVAIVESVTSYYQEGGRFTTAVRGLNEAPLALGFAKDNSELSQTVAREMSAMRDSGWLGKLFDKYGVTLYGGPIQVATGALPAR